MKRKRSAQRPVPPPPPRAESAAFHLMPPSLPAWWDAFAAVLFSLLLLAAMTVQTQRVTLLLTGLALILCLPVGRVVRERLRSRLCLPMLGFLAFALMNGLAAIYAPMDSLAVLEYYKFLASFALGAILLVRFDKRHIQALMWGFLAVCALIALLSVDAASWTVLFNTFNNALKHLDLTSFDTVVQDVWGTRVSGIYNNANVSGSIFALASLAGLYLTRSSHRLWTQVCACFLMGVNAQAFFLSMSRGAIICFAVALLTYVLAVGKGERLSLFFLLFISAVVTVALSIFAMGGIVSGSVVADLITLLTGLVIFALYYLVGSHAVGFLSAHIRAAVMAVAGLLVVSIAYVAVALHVTGSYTFDESAYLSRTVELEQGEYALSGQWSGELHTTILWQNELQLLLGKGNETLYSGPAEDARFIVPEGEGRLSIQFWGEEGGVLQQVAISDGTEVSLGYPLLPTFVANRLQDNLLSSNSFLLRLQFFKDAWALFLKSPLIGLGLGGSEAWLTSVQPVFYESKYVHNHLLQAMTDMGLLGLVSLLSLMGGTLWLLLRRLRAQQDSLAAVLLACWVMMNLHGLMELTFSVRSYQCVAWCVLSLIIIAYGEPISQKLVKVGGWALSGGFCLYFAVFGGLLATHRQVQREAEAFASNSPYEFLDTLERCARRDVFENEYFKRTFVINMATFNDSRYTRRMLQWVEELREGGVYESCAALAQYYYLPRGEYESMFACSREGIAQVASMSDAWNFQLDFYREDVLSVMTEQDMPIYIKGVLDLQTYLAEYSEGRLEEIVLTEENQAFLSLVSSSTQSDIADEALYQLLMGQSIGQLGQPSS